MSELEKQRNLIDQIIDKKLNISENRLLIVYKNSLKNIREQIIKLNERSEWSINELKKYDRLKSIQSQILDEIKLLSKEVYEEIYKTNKDIFLTNYNRSQYAYTKEVKTFISFNKINADEIRAIIEQPYPNIKLKDFIEKIGSQTFEKLKMLLAENLLSGNNMFDLTKKIKTLLGKSYYEASRILRTEGLRASSKSQLISTEKAENLGLEIIKIWNSTLDSRTRDHHRYMDGKKADKNGIFHMPGGAEGPAPRMTGVAKEDIQCRCSYNEEIKDITNKIEKRIDNETKKIIDNLTYEEWYKKYRKAS